MLDLSTKIKIDKDTMNSPNLAGKFSEEDLKKIGSHCYNGYTADKFSRMQWEHRVQSALDLALQMTKDKTFPWPGCANVAFPLVTIATLQFHSRAYPTIISGTDIVKYRVVGPDPDGSKTARAKRIGDHMSYQVLEEDQSWEEQHDRLLINIPIVGCAFVKSYYDGVEHHNVSEFVPANDLVIDYYAKSVETARRKTHVLHLSRNEIYEKVMSEVYTDVLKDSWFSAYAVATSEDTHNEDHRTGRLAAAPDADTPFICLEQHCWLDLDQDGYQEPYVVTFEESSHTVLRIVARFERESDVIRTLKGKIVKIRPTEYFTKYGFIPSPDGSIYDIGFGVLLGPLNEATNSLVNQLIDAGTMANSAGGFLGRGAKFRDGVSTFSPLEWKRVDATGDDLKKSLVPLPVREPSAVLFNLLSLLINYTQRISGTTDVIMGENPGQNTPAQTTQSLIEQGTKIYNAIFKRVWRSMKQEFQKLYTLNTMFGPLPTAFEGQQPIATRDDYMGPESLVVPVADPTITSDQMRFQQAMAVKQSAMQTPGYNTDEVERRYLRALRVEAVDQIFPGTAGQQQAPGEKLQIAQMKFQLEQAKMQMEQQQFLMDLYEQRRVNSAQILELEAKAAKAMAEAGGIAAGHQIAAFQTAVGALKTHDDALRAHIEQAIKRMEIMNGQPRPTPAPDTRGMGAMENELSNQGNVPAPQAPAGGSEGAMGGGNLY